MGKKRDGKIFKWTKFRSNDEDDPADSSAGRTSKLGSFVAWNFINELPQFLNVWIGDMSVIGPNAQVVSNIGHYSECMVYYGYRHKVKPGIFGFTEVLGYQNNPKNIQDMKDRINLDIYYARHW